MSTSIVLFANGYLEVVCIDSRASPLLRHYLIRRTVDYGCVCIQ